MSKFDSRLKKFTRRGENVCSFITIAAYFCQRNNKCVERRPTSDGSLRGRAKIGTLPSLPGRVAARPIASIDISHGRPLWKFGECIHTCMRRSTARLPDAVKSSSGHEAGRITAAKFRERQATRVHDTLAGGRSIVVKTDRAVLDCTHTAFTLAVERVSL